MSMTERDIDSEALLTPAARLLLWLYREGGEVPLAKARSTHGSKIQSHIYKLALHGLVEVSGEARGKRLLLTAKGRAIAACLEKCLSAPRKADKRP